MSDARMKLSPPWWTYVKKMEALFDGDPQIAFDVGLETQNPHVVLACNNGDKVTALRQILPYQVTFGNVTLNIIVDGVASNRTFKTKKELFDAAFKGNPVYVYSVYSVYPVVPTDDEYGFSMVYVVFKCCVVQYFCDNMNDCHGIESTLYQEIAKEILTGDGAQGVYFNTNVEVRKLGKPLDEWP
jgi:hypothetical protein